MARSPEAQREATRRWMLRHPERYRESQRSYRQRRRGTPKQIAACRRQNLRANYGLTEGNYAAMLIAQEGRCYICGQEETRHRNGKPTYLCVDHDHATGKVRALLCRRCNSVVGYVNENPALLEKTAAYIRQFRGLEYGE